MLGSREARKPESQEAGKPGGWNAGKQEVKKLRS